MTLQHAGGLRDHRVDRHSAELTFEAGRLKVTSPGDRIVRVRFSTDGTFAARRSWDTVPADTDSFEAPLQCDEVDDGWLLAAGDLGVLVSSRDGRVGFRTATGVEFACDADAYEWRTSSISETQLREKAFGDWPDGRASTEVRLRKTLAADEHVYGFGQRIGLLDRRGRVLTNWTVDPASGHGRKHDNMYQAHPSFVSVRPGLAWGCFLHSSWYSRFDVAASRQDTLEMLTMGGELDYYIMLGPTPAGVVERLTWLTGRPMLPPLWALGYHQSRWSYMDEGVMRDLVDEFRQRDIPLDAVHFDIDYMRGYRDFTWDPERFPDPARLLGELRAQGVRSVTIIDPGVKDDVGAGYETADTGSVLDAFIRTVAGDPFVGYCWPDAALFPDFARPDVREWWGAQHAGHLTGGVDGIWNDMNEPAIFERPFSEGASEQKPMPVRLPQGPSDERTAHAEVHNLYGLLMSRATYEGLRALRPSVRPWVLSRSGFTGIQRYAAVWMGDNHSWWEHLEASLPQLASMGLSGVPHVGADIGGFMDNPSAELYARWIQMGTFYPFMRTHSASDTNQQEPWSFGVEVEEIAREAIRLRYRLLPYVYTLAHEAHETGAPLLRPMVYEFPDDDRTHHLEDQMMFGPHLLVAPVCRPGVRQRLVYLPAGTWFDFHTGERRLGPQVIVADAPLDKIPLYVRGGAVLPLANVRRSTMDPLTTITLDVYPSGSSEWTMVEDDGASDAHERGAIARTTIRVGHNPEETTIAIGPRSGSYVPAARKLGVRVHLPERAGGVVRDGAACTEWTWDSRRRAVEVGWEDDGGGHELRLLSPPVSFV